MDTIKEILKDIDTYICPRTWTPIYQVLSAMFFGFLFGPFNKAIIWTAIFYIFYESIYYWATKNRDELYLWKVRLFAIWCGLLSILFSKCVWGSYPINKIFL